MTDKTTTIQKIVSETIKAFNTDLESFKNNNSRFIFIESFAAIAFDDNTKVELEIRFLEKQDLTRLSIIHDVIMYAVADMVKQFSNGRQFYFTYTSRLDYIKITTCWNLKMQFTFHEVEQ